MKTIQLTKGYVTTVDDEDYEWLSQWNWYAKVRKRKNWGIPYATRKENGHTRSMHTAIAQRHGIWIEGKEVDHKDGNRLNNQLSNLRPATGAQNQANQLARPGTSRFKGVSWDKDRELWRADIRHEGVRLVLGRYETEEEAAEVYNKKASELFGEYAMLNALS